MTLLAKKLTKSAEEYYADKLVEGPTLNYSTARRIVNESPLHAWTYHPKGGGLSDEPTAQSQMGNIIHSLMLDGGKGIVEVNANDFKTKAAQELRDAALAGGKLPIVTVKLQQARAVASKFQSRLSEFGIHLSGESEVTLLWQEASPLGVIDCRGRLDHLICNKGQIFDIKTTGGSAHPDACGRKIWEMGYDIQAAAYTSAVAKLLPLMGGRIDFVFLFMELDPPYSVTPLRPDGTMRALGEARWHRAIDTWARCVKNNKWPGYTDCIAQVAPPPWAMSKEIEEVISGDV